MRPSSSAGVLVPIPSLAIPSASSRSLPVLGAAAKYQRRARTPAGTASPYQIGLIAAVERSEEEARIRKKLEEQRRRTDLRVKDRQRKTLLAEALHESRRERQLHAQKIALLDEQKRLRALREIQRGDERSRLARSDIYARFFEPTPEVRELRELHWQARRVERRRQCELRAAHLARMQDEKISILLAKSEARRERAASRKSAPQLPPPTR